MGRQRSLTWIEHLAAFSCRRTYGSADRPWSEHATANAIDISAFVLEDGRRISLIGDWNDAGQGDGPRAGREDKTNFLHRARGGACQWFAIVLSPD